MASQFITNQDRRLADEISNIMPAAASLRFLVGYFYFSGFEQIYRNLADKRVKILVGLDLERGIAGRLRESETLRHEILSRGQIRENYNNSLVSLFNDSDFFDKQETQEAFRLFLKKLMDGTLEIRKTKEPNHAKLYVFENKKEFNQNGSYPGTVITGSSNLTRSGLETRFEINVDFRDAAHYLEAADIFERLWKDSVAIVDSDHLDEFREKVLNRIWIDRLPSPYLLFIRVMQEYFSEDRGMAARLPAEITEGQYLNLKYQTDAIKCAVEVIGHHNGVILADVVGLGKSVVASAVARNLNLKTIIITPPHLVDLWEDYRYRFGYNALVYSRGRLEEALNEKERLTNGLIIIDEAHRYRNELTQDYGRLHRLCQGNKVMLLSATPFNNAPEDIFSMLKLFQIPARSTLQTVQNLSYEFRELIREYRDIRRARKQGKESPAEIERRIRAVAGQIRRILSPLVIRRSRLDLDAIEEYKTDLKNQGISFPKVNPPKILEYDLGPLSELYEKTLEEIIPENGRGGFIGARYMPINYLRDGNGYREKIAKDLGIENKNLLREIQVNLAAFMRRLLVRRFESSMEAFRSTLDSMIASYEKTREWHDRLGHVPIYKKGNLPDVDELEESIGEEIDAKLRAETLEKELSEFTEQGLQLIPREELTPRYIKDLEQDMALLKSIRERWSEKNREDPKLRHFREIIEKQIKNDPKRKIVVFTEFSDTANYLYENLKDTLRVFKYSASDASKAAKQIIRENFDAGYDRQKNDYDALIATDAISEGFNLHRAGAIFNYDIPYNPTRVIQRVGRINRVNKKVFDELFIYNYFPTTTGERETHLKEISTLKMSMVHALFGEDTRILTSDEQLQTWMAGRFQEGMQEQEELSPEAPFENLIRRLRASHPEVLRQALDLPKRSRIQREVKKGRPGVLIFAKKGAEYAFKFSGAKKEVISISAAEALALFEADLGEKPLHVSKKFQAVYEAMTPRLFQNPSQVEKDKSKTETINKIRLLIERRPQNRDYLEDILRVVETLDALPAGYARAVRDVDWETLDEDMSELIARIPSTYLVNIIQREREIEDTPETLILSEELL